MFQAHSSNVYDATKVEYLQQQNREVTFVTAEGNKYVGQPWIEGEPVVGALYYSFGNRYQGELLDGQPHGYGKMEMCKAHNNTSNNNESQQHHNSTTASSLPNSPKSAASRNSGGGTSVSTQPPQHQCSSPVVASVNNNNNASTTTSATSTIIYDGEWKHGLRSGQGRLRKFSAGVSSPLLYLYEGMFANDLPHGSGTETIYHAPPQHHYSAKNNNSSSKRATSNSSTSYEGRVDARYTGSFKNGLRHGHSCLLEDEVKGRIIEGEFREGLPWGRVMIRWTKDNTVEHLRSFDGEFVKGEMHGQGTLVLRNGELFRGEFQHDKRKEGVITDADGGHQRRAYYDDAGLLVRFEDVESGSMGYANINNNNGDNNGEEQEQQTFSPGNNNNTARSILPPNQQQAASNNNKNADLIVAATIKFPNGDEYFGESLSGKASGKGKLVFANNGGWYEGGFVEGRFHGIGKLLRNTSTFEKGKKINSSCGTGEDLDLCCDVDDDKDSSSSTRTFSCWRYEGKFADGYFNGFGKWWNFTGDSYDGNFIDGAMNGIGKYVFGSSGQQNNSNNKFNYRVLKYEGEFLNNKPHGAGAKWFENRVVRGSFENGTCCDLEHGTVEYFAEQQPRTTQLQSQDQQAAEEEQTQSSSSFSVDEVVETYVGGIFKDKRDGPSGEMRYADGSVYYGEFSNDMRHGVGILMMLVDGNKQQSSSSSSSHSMLTAGTTIYEGKFVNDEPQGTCVVKNVGTSNRVMVGSTSASNASIAGVVTDASGFEKQIVA